MAGILVDPPTKMTSLISLTLKSASFNAFLQGSIDRLTNSSIIVSNLARDNGTFKCINTSTKIKSYKGQQVSLFSNDKTIKITSNNLMYNFRSSSISSLFYGTLNESLSDTFILNISHGKLLIYQNY